MFVAINLQQPNQTLRRPTQAVILAGGRGERMPPLTHIRPKPMIEIHGKPFLEHQILMLREQGFKRILLLLGYLPEVVRHYSGDGRKWGIQIQYSITAVEDNTGRRIKLAEKKLEDCFLLGIATMTGPCKWTGCGAVCGSRRASDADAMPARTITRSTHRSWMRPAS